MSIQTFLALTIACFVLSLAACAPSNQDAIVGKWEQVNAPGFTVEFSSDGRVTFLGLRGSYQFLDDKRVRLNLGSATHLYAVAISGDQLTLSPEGLPASALRFTRVK